MQRGRGRACLGRRDKIALKAALTNTMPDAMILEKSIFPLSACFGGESRCRRIVNPVQFRNGTATVSAEVPHKDESRSLARS